MTVGTTVTSRDMSTIQVHFMRFCGSIGANIYIHNAPTRLQTEEKYGIKTIVKKIKRNHSISAHSINPVANKKPSLKKDGFFSKVCDAGPNVYLFYFHA